MLKEIINKKRMNKTNNTKSRIKTSTIKNMQKY